MKYYRDLKLGEPQSLDEDHVKEKIAHLQFMSNMEKAYQVSLPTFARQDHNELFLSEVRFTDSMAQSLSQYLTTV